MIELLKKQLEEVIAEYESLHEDEGPSATRLANLQTRCIAAIERASGRNSTYSRQITEISKRSDRIPFQVGRQIGVAMALLSDIQKDYLRTFEEQLHGDLFGDFLELAAQLTRTGKKDAAAVLVGTTLEVHIRQLCEKHGVKTRSGKHTKRPDTLNAELVTKGAYSKTDQKSVTAWIGLRNDAVHGEHSRYTLDQARLFVDSVRDFILRHPA